jgi:ribonuclease BN (tRNA processing enzyme)
VGQLALIHISPRYSSGEIHEQEAKAIFPQSFAPSDLDSLILKD